MSRIKRRYFLPFELQRNHVSVTQSGYYSLCGCVQYGLSAPRVLELESPLARRRALYYPKTWRRASFRDSRPPFLGFRSMYAAGYSQQVGSPSEAGWQRDNWPGWLTSGRWKRVTQRAPLALSPARVKTVRYKRAKHAPSRSRRALRKRSAYPCQSTHEINEAHVRSKIFSSRRGISLASLCIRRTRQHRWRGISLLAFNQTR